MLCGFSEAAAAGIANLEVRKYARLADDPESSRLKLTVVPYMGMFDRDAFLKIEMR